MEKKNFLFILITISFYASMSQCMMTPISLSQRVANSSLMIEGKVINRMSFWNDSHTNIYTSNLVEVYKTFKNSSAPYIEVITEGGTVGNKKEVVQPSLELSMGDVGVFTLNQNSLPSQFGKPVFESYASAQGFIKYNLLENEADEPFKKYINISKRLYTDLQLVTESTYIVVKPIDLFLNENFYSTQAAPVITGFSPATITAGTFSIVTIDGSGFGNARGTSFVEFRRADDGGNTFCRPDTLSYVSWSASQIKVKLTSAGASNLNSTPGSGVIRVDVGGLKATSSSSLTVSHAEMNVYSNGQAPFTIYNTRHVSMQAGGYVWQMFTGFDSNAPAKASFLRAFQSWRCGTFINWSIGAITTKDVAASDNVNVIRFDIGTELPAGVLARCSNYFNGCGLQPNEKWYVSELDIVFNDATVWNYSTGNPTASQFDFESVALHELGHGHELQHVINTAEIMHYLMNPGKTKRILTTNSLIGGDAVMARNVSGVCSKTAMLPLNSTNCLGQPQANFTVNNSTICVGETATFTNLSQGNPLSNVWTFEGGAPSTSTISSPSITYTTAGTYSVQLTSSNVFGTSTFSVAAYIEVNLCTEIQSLNGVDAIGISPNPNNGIFTVSHYSGKLEIEILNVLGQTVKNEIGIDSHERKVDLSGMPNGIYYVKILTEDRSKLFKLILDSSVMP